MKAAVFRGAGKPLSIENVDDPKPGPRDVILRVHRCGICATDLHMTSGHGWDFPDGTILGHEFAGEIVDVGSEVERFKKGDLITGLPSQGCGHCEACAHENWTLCHNAGSNFGGYAELLRIPDKVAVKLPSTLSLVDGALVEPLAVGLHAVRLARIRPGDRVLVQGAGAVALMVIYWAKRLGAGRVVAVSRSARRAAMVLEMGADAFVESTGTEQDEVIAALGGAPSIVFECVGVPGFLERAINYAGVYGHVLSLGFCTSPETIIPARAGIKGVSLSFPVGYSIRDFEYSADTMLSGKVDPKMVISSVVSMDEFPAAFDRLRSPNLETKVHLAPFGILA